MHTTHPTPALRTLAALSVAALGLTACTDTESDTGDGESPDTAAASLTVEDIWTRGTDTSMTGVFGEITNSSEEEVEILAAESPAAETVELHEVVEDEDGVEQMREIDGGFPLPAEGTLTLKPGDDHLMLMGLHEELHTGDSVEITLTLSDDSEFTFEAMVKDEGGDDAPYDEQDGDHGEHHHDEDDDGDEEGHDEHD